jgi:hypothetical protein
VFDRLVALARLGFGLALAWVDAVFQVAQQRPGTLAGCGQRHGRILADRQPDRLRLATTLPGLGGKRRLADLAKADFQPAQDLIGDRLVRLAPGHDAAQQLVGESGLHGSVSSSNVVERHLCSHGRETDVVRRHLRRGYALATKLVVKRCSLRCRHVTHSGRKGAARQWVMNNK